jgi:hypothetical protein
LYLSNDPRQCNQLKGLGYGATSALQSAPALVLHVPLLDAPATNTAASLADSPQIAKLLIIPFVAVMEVIWFQRRFTPAVTASMVTVVIGVAIV